MSLRRRHGLWHYRFQYEGATYQRSTGLKGTERNRGEALLLEAQHRQLLETGERPMETVPFSKAWERFLIAYTGEIKPSSLERLRVSSVGWILFLGETPIHQIAAADIEEYKQERRKRGIKEVTLRHDLHALSVLLQYARKQSWTKFDPLDGVKIPSDKDARRERVLSAPEERQYFAEAAKFPALHDLGRLMILQGLRPEEAQRIAKADVDFTAGTLTVHWGKTSASRRTLRLTEESARILGRRVAGKSQWVFPSPRPQGKGDIPIGRINGPHGDACNASGVDFTLYDLRHTFATRLADQGCDPYTLARLLGHSGLHTVSRYVHVQQETMNRAMKVFNEANEKSGKRPLIKAKSDLGRRAVGTE